MRLNERKYKRRTESKWERNWNDLELIFG